MARFVGPGGQRACPASAHRSDARRNAQGPAGHAAIRPPAARGAGQSPVRAQAGFGTARRADNRPRRRGLPVCPAVGNSRR